MPRPSSLRALLVAALVLVGLASSLVAAPDPRRPAETPGADELDRRLPVNIEEAGQLQGRIRACLDAVRPTVVAIDMGNSFGSGTIITPDGYIATAAHVTESPRRRCSVILADGTRLPAVTLGMDRTADYGLVKADTGGRELPFVETADTANVAAGQWLVALGHPLGPELDPYRPPVCRVGRVRANTSDGPDGVWHLKVDAPLISGDSGGGMFDLDGRLVAINVSILIGNPEANNATAVTPFVNNMERMKNGAVFEGGGFTPRDYQTTIERAYQLIDRDQWERAIEAMETAIEAFPDIPEGHYHLACAYSLWGAATAEDAAGGKRLDTAIDHLRQAIELGFDDESQLLQDPNLDALRSMEPVRSGFPFFALLGRLRGHRAYLGIDMVAVQRGVRITRIGAGTAAALYGLRFSEVIVAVDDVTITTRDQLIQHVRTYQPGDRITVMVRRSRRLERVPVILGGRPSSDSSRPRTSSELRRCADALLALLQDKTVTLQSSVARIEIYGAEVGLGLVVHEKGLIACKGSDLGDTTRTTVHVFIGDEKMQAKVAIYDERSDLALLHVGREGLVPIPLDDAAPELGAFLFNVDSEGTPFSLGIRALGPYVTIRPWDRPWLGAELTPCTDDTCKLHSVPAALRVGSLERGHYAGLRTDDVITHINGESFESRRSFAQMLASTPVGKTLKLTVQRSLGPAELDVVLQRDPRAPRNPSREEMKRRDYYDRVKGARSDRDGGFGRVIHHDGVVNPTLIGGPVVNLEGKVVAMNIARADRTKTYAIPVHELKRLIATLREQMPARFR